MKFKILSDLHLEASPEWRPKYDPSNKELVLILAGDICEIERSTYLNEFLTDMSEQFKHVIHVPGNHEYYGGHIIHSFDKLYNFSKTLPNVSVLNNELIIIDDIKIIGSTLWTDCDKGNPSSKFLIQNGMNDYRKIRIKDYRKLTVNDTISIHNESIKFIIDELSSYDGKCIVVTHHTPSTLSIDDKFMGNPLNGGYSSDLSNIILDYNPILWCHGHTHDSFDYYLGETQIICNPKGYPRGLFNSNTFENVNFDDDLVINI